MENNLKVIPIFFAVDDKYIPFLSIALQSLTDNASKNYYYAIKILYTNIEEKNKKKILKYEKQNIKIEFVDLNYYIEEIKDKLYTRDYFTQTTYFRLFIPDLYPQYDKAIYLDSDVVVLGDIANLYNIELGDNLIGAAPDEVIQTNKVFQEYVERVVGVADYRKYFNAGVLLMNLDKMRRFHFQSKFLYLLETIKFTVVQDQDYLNRICKGRTKLLSTTWDKMPIYDEKVKDEDINIIHFNLIYKPVHFSNVLYEKYFWEYSKKTEFYQECLNIKNNYTEDERFRDMKQYENLKLLAQKETDCVGDDRIYARGLINEEKQKERIEILKKIESLEESGDFDVDVEDDPPTITLLPDDVDYLNKKTTNKIKSKIAYKVGERFVNNLLRDNKLIIKDVKGIENLTSLKEGAVITCNHFNPYDSFTIEAIFNKTPELRRKKLFKVIREGNYTNFPGLYGFFFRNCYTLPLSSSMKTMVEFMKATDTILKRKDFILIYPEQSMWWNYRKPKPDLKDGAYKISLRSNVPIIPIFITMQDSDIIGDDGFAIQEYTVNISKPIYPDTSISEKEARIKLKNENYEVWKNIYEEFYGMPLKYTTVETRKSEEVGA